MEVDVLLLVGMPVVVVLLVFEVFFGVVAVVLGSVEGVVVTGLLEKVPDIVVETLLLFGAAAETVVTDANGDRPDWTPLAFHEIAPNRYSVPACKPVTLNPFQSAAGAL